MRNHNDLALAMKDVVRGPLATREECRDCPFAGPDGYAAKPVVGIGPRRPKYVALGEGPGGTEVRQGLPFVGPAGALVTAAIEKTGCRREDVWIGNTTLCVPFGKDKDKTMPKALTHCRARLLRELRAAGDVPIIAMGKWASQALLGAKLKVTEVAGCYFDQEIEGLGRRRIIPTIHPAHILRGGGGEGGGGAHAVDLLYLNLIYDFAKIRRVADGSQAPFEETIAYEFLQTKRADALVKGIAADIRKSGMFACDVETLPVAQGECKSCTNCRGHSAVEPYYAKLLAVGLATEERAVSVAWPRLSPEGRATVKALLADPRIVKVFHNCLTGDSRVWLANGSRVPIRTLVRERSVGPVLCIDEQTGELTTGRIVGWTRGTPRAWADWLRIRVRGKGCLRITVDHEVLTDRGRVRADQVRVGDRLLTVKPVLTPQQHAVLYGSLLGDGSIALNSPSRTRATGMSRSPHFTVSHGQAQKGYLNVKRRALGDLVANVSSRVNDRGFSANSPGILTTVRTHRDARLHDVYAATHNGDGRHITTTWLSRLTDAALAVWYCDDGHLQGTNAHICVSAFGHHGARRLLNWLRKHGWPARLDIRSDAQLYIRVAGPYGRGLSSDMIKFWASIAPYVPRCMAWKLPERFRTLADGAFWRNVDGNRVAWGDVVTTVEPLHRSRNSKVRYGGYSGRGLGPKQFCLSVEGHHNFFAEGLSVSNSLYDRTVFARYGMPVAEPVHCTLLGHHNAFPGLDHKLQRVASQFFLISPWKAEFRNGKGAPAELHAYNARDTLVTARLQPVLQLIIKKSNAERAYAMDRRMAEVATKMALDGIPIDLAENRRLASVMKPKIDELEASLVDRISDGEVKARFMESLATERAKRKRKDDGEDFMQRHALRLEEAAEEIDEGGINIDSADQIIALLKACGVPLLQVTKAGKPSTRKEVLAQLVDYPVVKDLLFFRALDKLYGTFVEPMPYRVDRDSRMHVSWGVTMITGRFNSKPNVQNLSKGSDRRGTPNIRSQIAAPAGRVLVGGDLAQVEMRAIGLHSGEPYLLKAFKDGVDIHSEFSKLVFPNFAAMDPKSRERKELRDHMKRGEYGYVYRAVPTTVWKQAFIKEGHDVPLSVVMKMYRVLKERMPLVERWHAEKYRRVVEKLEIRDAILGRRRMFPLGQIDATVVANWDIQSYTASLMGEAVDRFDQAVKHPRYGQIDYLIQGHDSWVVECDEDKADKVKALLDKCFTAEKSLNGITMPFPVESDIGKRLSEV